MSYFADTPDPPYTAVIFTAIPQPDRDGYDDTAIQMVVMAQQQPGFIGVESSPGPPEITVSYWETEEHAKAWKAIAEHRVAQKRGREEWYADYRVRVSRVERAYGPTR